MKVWAETVSPLLPPIPLLPQGHFSTAAAQGLQLPTPLRWGPLWGQTLACPEDPPGFGGYVAEGEQS